MRLDKMTIDIAGEKCAFADSGLAENEDLCVLDRKETEQKVAGVRREANYPDVDIQSLALKNSDRDKLADSISRGFRDSVGAREAEVFFGGNCSSRTVSWVSEPSQGCRRLVPWMTAFRILSGNTLLHEKVK
jgi:hypothetical protein